MKYVTYQKKRTGDPYAQRKKARQHLAEARRLVAERSSGRGRPEEEVIAALRATREQLWKAKLALHS